MDEAKTHFPKPVAWPDRLVVWAAAWEESEGVPVAVGAFGDEETLRTRVAEGLRLLARYAPEDLARVRVLMRGVVVSRLHGANAHWRQSLRVCVLSTHFLRRAETSAERVAATIIHELMHARLDALGFDYREQRRARIERICFRSSRRFLEKLPESDHRTAALAEIEEFLAFDTDVWRAVLGRDYRPWYLRMPLNVLQRIIHVWHRDAPT